MKRMKQTTAYALVDGDGTMCCIFPSSLLRVSLEKDEVVRHIYNHCLMHERVAEVEIREVRKESK